MPFYLSESYGSLEPDERRRIQRRLGFIFRSGEKPRILHKSITDAYRRAGSPEELLWMSDEVTRTGFFSLLDRFGVQSLDELHGETIEALRSLPYVVFFNNFALIPAEAYVVLAKDRFAMEKRFLFSYLQRLSMPEWKAYWNWIHSKTSSTHSIRNHNYRIRFLELYERLGAIRKDSDPSQLLTEASGIYLDEVCDIDPARSPMGWFQNSVVPFYHAIQEMEKTNGDPQKDRLIQSFKLGYLIVVREDQGFDKPNRWQIVSTKEQQSYSMNDSNVAAISLSPDDPQGSLF